MFKKILAVGAYPDDIELGCAGTLRKFQTQYNAEIDIVYTLSPYHDVADIVVGRQQLIDSTEQSEKDFGIQFLYLKTVLTVDHNCSTIVSL